MSENIIMSPDLITLAFSLCNILRLVSPLIAALLRYRDRKPVSTIAP
jgi:hypothetical protein